MINLSDIASGYKSSSLKESRLSRLIKKCTVLLMLAIMLAITLPASVMAFTEGEKEQERASVSLKTVFVDIWGRSKDIPGAVTKLVNTGPDEKEYVFKMPSDGGAPPYQQLHSEHISMCSYLCRRVQRY